MKEELEFKLEMERFKQKATWENRMFFVILTTLVGILIYYIKENKTTKLSFWIILFILGLFLVFGEILVNYFLDKEKKKIKEKFN